MLTTQVLIFWLLVAAIGYTGWQALGKRLLSFEARDRRRRQKNYGRVRSRRKRPAVRLAVKVARA